MRRDPPPQILASFLKPHDGPRLSGGFQQTVPGVSAAGSGHAGVHSGSARKRLAPPKKSACRSISGWCFFWVETLSGFDFLHELVTKKQHVGRCFLLPGFSGLALSSARFGAETGKPHLPGFTTPNLNQSKAARGERRFRVSSWDIVGKGSERDLKPFGRNPAGRCFPLPRSDGLPVSQAGQVLDH